MIILYVSHPCLMPVTRTDGKRFWTACTAPYPLEPTFSERLVYISPGLAGLVIIGIVSCHLTFCIARQRRLNRIATRLQHIIALERVLILTSKNGQ